MTDPRSTLIDEVVIAANSPTTLRPGQGQRSRIAEVLMPAMNAFDVLLAWASGEISEGRACEILNVSRTSLRAMRIQAVSRVTGDMDDADIATKRAKTMDRLDAWVEEYATDRCSVSDGATVRTFWKRARASEDFLQRLDDWRGLCPPGVAMFSSEGGKG